MEGLARGETAVLAIRNETNFPHSIHLHGMHFRILRRGGEPVSEGFRDTVTMGAMETAEIALWRRSPAAGCSTAT